MTDQKKRIRASLYSLFIGDALSMPVHWFYRCSDIVRYFPPFGIERMEAAPEDHPSSIMSLHSTEYGGRRKTADGEHGGAEGHIVGNIILKGKAHHWDGSRTHYHHGMAAGDNTLNACCAKLMIQHLTERGRYDKTAWIDAYIEFMTAEPARHPDTYAESYHRSFFANLSAGKPPLACGSATHDTPSMGALVTVAPLVCALYNTHSLEQAQIVCCEHVQLTHPDTNLLKVVNVYVSLMYCFLSESFVSESITKEFFVEQYALAANALTNVGLKKLLLKKSGDAAIVGGLFSSACYISDSWPSVCYLAAKYFETPGKALLVNTNLGGENAHRGAVLGGLIGVSTGEYDNTLFNQLAHRNEIERNVNAFIDMYLK